MDVVADIFRPVFLNLSRIWSLEGPFPPSEEAVEVHSAICNLTAPVPNNVWRAVELACNVAEKTWHRTNREAITKFFDKARLGAGLL